MTQTNLFDRPVSRETRKEALGRVAPKMLRDQHRRILVAMAEAGSRGLTDEEGVAETYMTPSSYRPRRGELAEMGAIKESGGKRPTMSKRMAAVWVLTGKVLP